MGGGYGDEPGWQRPGAYTHHVWVVFQPWGQRLNLILCNLISQASFFHILDVQLMFIMGINMFHLF